ncbi:MAG: site-specific DNA-methyltransferase, partial [Clostridium sp.]|nr:site-specific DNA-methyltransferase [Clostridium sp.]
MKETINDELKMKDIDTIEKINGESLDIVKENVKKLKEIFPEVFCEDKIDFKRLEEVLGEYTDDSDERYRFEWHGKSQAIKFSQTPSKGTLRPCKEESKNWDTTENLYIEGDNLEVLKLLQKSYQGKIKMIYIDPPYNTGNDFIYPDDYSDNLENYLKITGQKDEEGNRISTNTECGGRYHTNWLNMMYPRLRLAKNLLTDDGVIFISINKIESNNLKKICDEIFGEDNFITNIAVVNNLKGRSDDEYIATAHEDLFIYRKSNEFITYGVPMPEEYKKEYTLEDENGKYRLLGLRKRGSNSRRVDRPNMYYPFYYDKKKDKITLEKREEGIKIYPKLSDNTDGCWRWGRETSESRLSELEVKFITTRNEYDIYQKDYLLRKGAERVVKAKSFWSSSDFSSDSGTIACRDLLGSKVFSSPKAVGLIKYCLFQASKDNDIVLDFFSGSATTAHAVMQLNSEDNGKRKFIMVQLPEECDEKSEAYKSGYKNICEIGKERIRRAGDKIVEENKDKEGIEDLDIGFKVFKLDTSNIKPWNPDYDNLKMSLEDSVDNF